MPLYDYQCSKCGHVVEVRHGFDDVYSEPCPACGSALKRVFNPAPIVFKGSGFYVTDSRKKEAPAKEAAPKKEPAKDASSSSSPSSESAA